jgi:hypothetical protein
MRFLRASRLACLARLAFVGVTLGAAAPVAADTVSISWPSMTVDQINAQSGVWIDRKFYSAIQGAASTSYGHVYRQIYTGGSNCEWEASDAGDGWVYLRDRNNDQYLYAKSNGDMGHGPGLDREEAKWKLEKKAVTTTTASGRTTTTSTWVRFANKRFGTFLRAKDDESYRNVAWSEEASWQFYDPFDGDWLDGGKVAILSTKREVALSNNQTGVQAHFRYVKIDTTSDADWPGGSGPSYNADDCVDAGTKDEPAWFTVEPVTEQAIKDVWPASTSVAGLVRFKSAAGTYLWPSAGTFVRADGTTGASFASTAWAVLANTDGTHALRAKANVADGLKCVFDSFGVSGRAAYMCNLRDSEAEKIYVLIKR